MILIKKLQAFIADYYTPLLSKAIDNRYITLSIFAGVLMITLGLAMSPLVRFVFFSKLPSDFIEVELQMNAGTSLAERNKAIDRVEEAINRLNQEYALAHSGNELLDSFFVRSRGDTEGFLMAELTKSESREVDAFQVVDQWRDYVGDVPGIQKLNFSASTNAGGSKPNYFRLSGDDYVQLEAAASELTRKLASYDGVFDVENTMEATG